jgi:hypothetical protein
VRALDPDLFQRIVSAAAPPLRRAAAPPRRRAAAPPCRGAAHAWQGRTDACAARAATAPEQLSGTRRAARVHSPWPPTRGADQRWARRPCRPCPRKRGPDPPKQISRIEQVVNGTAAAAGAAAVRWAWSPLPYPPVINDAALAGLVAGVARRLEAAAAADATDAPGARGGGGGGAAIGVGGDGSKAPAPPPPGGVRYCDMRDPVMAAEDFSFYRARAGVRSAFAFLGIRSPGGLHTPGFSVEEARLPLGAATHAAVALEALAWLQGGGAAAGGAAANATASGACACAPLSQSQPAPAAAPSRRDPDEHSEEL